MTDQYILHDNAAIWERIQVQDVFYLTNNYKQLLFTEAYAVSQLHGYKDFSTKNLVCTKPTF